MRSAPPELCQCPFQMRELRPVERAMTLSKRPWVARITQWEVVWLESPGEALTVHDSQSEHTPF